jgi:hypothetical protein
MLALRSAAVRLPVLATALMCLGGAGAGATPPPLAVDSSLPAWLVPGARLVVRGWAGRDERVALRVDGRTVVARRAGRLGAFALAVRLGRLGPHALILQGEGRMRPLGTVRIRPLTLAAAGDVTFGDGVAEAIAAYGPDHPWASVGPLLRSADLATANLEGTVSTRGAPVAKAFTFRGPPAAVRSAAVAGGIDVLTLANNHSLDFGPAAFFDTLALAHQAGIATVGGGANLWAARRPAILERGGLRVAFLGYSDVDPDGYAAGASRPGTAPADPRQIDWDVRASRRLADVVVVWFHWGVELDRYPGGRQQELAAASFAAGADVVLGAHPHVLQPIARPSPRRLVAWSLGNFVFSPHSPGTDRTGILLLSLDARGVRGYSFRGAAIVGVQPRIL